MRALIPAFLLLVMPTAYGHEDVQRACTDLVLDYAYYRDRPDAEGFAGVFTEDGELTVLGQTFVGRQALIERLKDAHKGPSFRHLMSTIRIFPIDAQRARGVSYATVYSAPAGESEVNGFAAMGEYHDEFVLTAQGWRIAKREFIPVYTQATP